MTSDHNSIASTPYSVRADLPHTPPLTSYLLHLISIKRSNLCVSADVHTSSALLRLAEDVGDYICVLKTHADIIDDFSERTIKGLKEISRRKSFLIFEDRKFADIGSTTLIYLHTGFQVANLIFFSFFFPGTVQSQYTRGPLAIATWAHITNAHLLPGPAIISALHSAATATLTSLNQSVVTEIFAGTPRISLDGNDSDDEEVERFKDHGGDYMEGGSQDRGDDYPRKNSVVNTTTTISQTFEPSLAVPWARSLSASESSSTDREDALRRLGPPPHARALLVIAEMSSEGNLITPNYTSACISAAREQSDFVMGFISQHSLNSAATDLFVNFTPGINLPPKGCKEGEKGDGMGQKWSSPREAVVKNGADVIIVGRGVLGAKDRKTEAERYRKKAWEAYEQRIGRRDGKRDD